VKHNRIPGPSTVYVAKIKIRDATSTEKMISGGMIELKSIDSLTVPLEAVRSLNDIAGKWAVHDIPKGAVLLVTNFATPSIPISPPPHKPSKSP